MRIQERILKKGRIMKGVDIRCSCCVALFDFFYNITDETPDRIRDLDIELQMTPSKNHKLSPSEFR